MDRYIRVSLPAGIANELVDAKLAVRPITTRSSGLAEAVSISVNCINTGASVVTLAVAVGTCRQLVRAVLRRLHPSDPDIIKLEIKSGADSKSLTVDRRLPTAEDDALDFLIAALNG
jgi:hypothetical protein